MGPHVILTAGTEFTCPGNPGIRIDYHDRAHGVIDDIARPPDIGSADIGQGLFINGYASDFHVSQGSLLIIHCHNDIADMFFVDKGQLRSV